MGCGATSKNARTTSRPQMLPTSLQPISDQSQLPARLPQVVLDGFAKCLKVPARDPTYCKRRPVANAQPFAGIIEDPLVQEYTSVGRRPQRNRDSEGGSELGFELMQATTGLAAPSNTIRRGNERRTGDEEAKEGGGEMGTLAETVERYGPFQPSEGTQEAVEGTFPVRNTQVSSAPKQEMLPETSQTGLLNSEKSHSRVEHSLDPSDQMPNMYQVQVSTPDMSLPPTDSPPPPLADQASLPTNPPDPHSLSEIQNSTAGVPESATELEAPSLHFPQSRRNPVLSNSEESAQSSNIPPSLYQVPESALSSSQHLATERLSRFYNSERGLSPLPSRPPNELSDDEDFEITGVIDETRKAVQLARAKASQQTASSDVQSPEAETT